jgi:KaiC/GvpD/RAD55 family RecA-like ATPase
MGLADQILGPEPATTHRAPRVNGGDAGPWQEINDIDPQLVGDRLGIERDGRRIRHCPNCNADSGVDFVSGGWKCLHASCSSMGKNGFRTNIDSIMELRKCDLVEAARWAASQFGTAEPTGKRERSAPRANDDPPPNYYDTLIETMPHVAVEGSELNRLLNSPPSPPASTKIGLKDGIKTAFTSLRARIERGEDLEGTASGYRQLDYAINGFKRRCLYVIGARSGMGKSILALNLAMRFADAGNRVLYFTLEMTNEEQVIRALFARAHVGVWRLKARKVFTSHWSQLATAAGEIANLPLHFDEACGLTDDEIERRIVTHKQEHGELFAVVIDHTLLVHGSNERQPRREQLNRIIERFKSVAKAHDVCVIALTQMNRGLEARNVKDKRPQISDLKETGAFEEFADATLLLYREDHYHYRDPNYDRDNVLEVIMPKIRGEEATVVKLKFTGSQYRIDPPENDEPPQETTHERDD